MMNQAYSTSADGFWARVRSALTGIGPTPEPRRAVGSGATQPLARVSDQFRRGWTIAAQREVPLSVMALEIDNYRAYCVAYGARAVEEALDTLEEIICSLLTGEGQGCTRTAMGTFVLVLPDMTLPKGRALAGKIAHAVRRAGLANRESHAGQVSMSVGLAVIEPEGKPGRLVSDAALQALRKAQRRGLGRLEIADLRTRRHAAQAA